MKRPAQGGRPRKLGRQELREIKRHLRRETTPEPEIQESSSESDEEPVFQRGKAYDALLTLLQSDHKEPKKKKAKVVEEQNDELEGLNLEAENESEESVSEFEDSDDDTENIFENRFNNVSDETVSLWQRTIDSTEKWPVTNKQKWGEPAYTSVTQAPLGSPQYSTKHQLKKKVQNEFSKEKLNPVEKDLFHNLLAYRDVCFPYKSYKHETYKRLYLLHILNHVTKTRERILKNNEKLHRYNEAVKHGTLKEGQEEPELRDLGFTRPKVLVLLPTRHAAYEMVEQLIKLSGCEQLENRKRFKTQFYDKKELPSTRPDDFKHMFKGNLNDFFSIGLKFTRKAVKLYLSFYNSDVLVASPIGLSMILEDPKTGKKEFDFLSSIEVLVVDCANQIEMQNWDHVNTVLKYTNAIPKEFHDADFSRIRMWYINEQAKYLRQTLVFGEFLTPSVSSVLSRSKNIAGRVRYKPVYTSQTCVMNSIGLKTKQIFQRFEASDPASNVDERFKFFANAVLPSITKQMSYDDGLLIYIPSYFDYVRVKSHLKGTKHTFASIDEYSLPSKLTRARDEFRSGKAKMLLYTERIHHYRRYELAGVKTVLVYEPPANPLFYKELVRFVGRSVFNGQADADLSFVKTIYSKLDIVALERIVGNERAPVLCHSSNEVFEFR